MNYQEIGQIWTEHFPRREHDRASGQIISLICIVLHQRADLDVLAIDFATRVEKVLRSAGIVSEEFAACVGNTKLELI